MSKCLGAAAGAAFYYLKKQKEEDPDLEEDFADFQGPGKGVTLSSDKTPEKEGKI